MVYFSLFTQFVLVQCGQHKQEEMPLQNILLSICVRLYKLREGGTAAPELGKAIIFDQKAAAKNVRMKLLLTIISSLYLTKSDEHFLGAIKFFSTQRCLSPPLIRTPACALQQ